MRLYWKRMVVPTKLTKLVCLLSIAVSVTVLSFCLITTQNIKISGQAHKDRNNQKFELMPEVKYILHWRNPTKLPVEYTDGTRLFQTRKCEFNNCYLTDQISLLSNFTSFHVVLFNSPDIQYFENSGKFPRKKTRYQKYVFVSGDSAVDFPVCGTMWNGFFNWAWTYKLDSDLVWRYFVIKNQEGKIIGPKKKMHWLKVQHMNPVDSKFIIKLQTKTKIAAWFVSTCKTESHREEFVDEVQNYLSQYKMEVDIYGYCGNHFCPKSDMDKCLDMLANEYFFYFAFENAFSDDYVTDIILHALQHDTVPVVYGGANYTRFLPDGSYLNALQFGPERLVSRMFEIMQNPSLYQMFFRWRNHYSYHAHSEFPETDNYCRLCELVNNRERYFMDALRVNFTGWWTPEGKCEKL